MEGEGEGALPTVPPGPGTGPSQLETTGTGNFIIVHLSYWLCCSGHCYVLAPTYPCPDFFPKAECGSGFRTFSVVVDPHWFQCGSGYSFLSF